MTIFDLCEKLLTETRFHPEMQVYIRDEDGTDWTLAIPYVENSRCILEPHMALVTLE